MKKRGTVLTAILIIIGTAILPGCPIGALPVFPEKSAEFCQKRGPHCLEIERVIFSSNKGVIENGAGEVLLKEGGDLTIRVKCSCCKWSTSVAHGVRLVAKVDSDRRIYPFKTMREGDSESASFHFDRLREGTYRLQLQLRASTRRGMDQEEYTIRVVGNQYSQNRP